MSSDKRNSIMAKAKGLTVQHHFSLRGAFWHTAVRKMHSSWTYQFVSHLSLLTVTCRFGGST